MKRKLILLSFKNTKIKHFSPNRRYFKMLHYPINDYLSLRLESGKTIILVKGRPFTQCMYLLLNISVTKIRDYDQINSIDEAAEVLNRSMERNRGQKYDITPETEFWGHCSNIQAWAENDYNTCILHRNLAFPLLRKLAEAGDVKAKRVYKDEIAVRFSSGHTTVMLYLLNQGYLKALNKEEIDTLMEDLDMKIFKDQSINILIKIFQHIDRLGYSNGKNLIKNQIRIRFEKGLTQDINNLIRRRSYYYYRRFFSYFNPEELAELVNSINIDQLMKQNVRQSFPLLKNLAQMGNTKAPEMIKEKTISSIQEKNIEEIRYIIKKKFLNNFEKSQIEEIFDESTIKIILNPEDRQSISFLRHLPDFIASSELFIEFIKTTLSGNYFVYKTYAAVCLINQFFDSEYEIIERLVTQYKNKIRLPVIKALINKDCEKADNLLKFIDWSRFRYVDRLFFMLDDKRITVERAHKTLLKNHFKPIEKRHSYTVYEFSSFDAFKDLSEKIDNLNENTIEEFTVLEQAFIRDARLVMPALPLFDIDLGPYKRLTIILNHLSYRKEIYFINRNNRNNRNRYYRSYFYSTRTGNTKNLGNVLSKQKSFCEEALQNKPNIIHDFYSEFNDFKKRLEQYYKDCKTLKTAINKYLSNTPELLLINNLNIEYKDKKIEDFRKVYPSTFKPSYQKETNTLILYEAHQWGKFHADSNIKVHESGVVMVFVNTFVNYSKRHNYHNAQVYFFFPKLKRFYTRKANMVKNFKSVNNWDISITNLFGYDFLKQICLKEEPNLEISSSHQSTSIEKAEIQ